jgi:ABC-type lipoprotein export system ATPase subunit
MIPIYISCLPGKWTAFAEKTLVSFFNNPLPDRLNLGHKLRSKITELSQGEQQRLAIARAVINKPVLILADEPTSALDDVNCRQVITLLENHAKEENATLVIVTHDQRLKDIFPNQITLGAL